MRATFITCGRIAEQQQPILARAVAEGHEIGSHGYNHEQIDDLPDAEQLAVIDRSVAVMRERGFALEGYVGPEIVRAENDASRGIVVLPFIIPNDWDARFESGQSASEMAAAWVRRLEKVAASGEPCFVLNIHQWIASLSDNLDAVRTFIRAAKARPDCRVLPLRETAQRTLAEMLRPENDGGPQFAREGKCLPI